MKPQLDFRGYFKVHLTDRVSGNNRQVEKQIYSSDIVDSRDGRGFMTSEWMFGAARPDFQEF
jgi:hypothetical protein